MMPLAMPALAAVHCIRSGRAVAARLSIAWLGQSLMSIGESVLIPSPPESFAAAQRAGLVDSLSAVGAATLAPPLAHLAVFVGCLLLAFALVSAFGFERRGK